MRRPLRQIRREEGFRVRSFRRHRLCFHWSLCIVILGMAAAVLCSSHPPTHDHDEPHPLLCIDVSSAVLFADGVTFPLPSKALTLVGPDATLGSFILVGLDLWARPLSPPYERSILYTPRLSLGVLRL